MKKHARQCVESTVDGVCKCKCVRCINDGITYDGVPCCMAHDIHCCADVQMCPDFAPESEETQWR